MLQHPLAVAELPTDNQPDGPPEDDHRTTLATQFVVVDALCARLVTVSFTMT